MDDPKIHEQPEVNPPPTRNECEKPPALAPNGDICRQCENTGWNFARRSRCACGAEMVHPPWWKPSSQDPDTFNPVSTSSQETHAAPRWTSSLPVPAGARATLVALWSYGRLFHGVICAWPTIAALSDRSGFSQRGTRRHLAVLTAARAISRNPNRGWTLYRRQPKVPQ